MDLQMKWPGIQIVVNLLSTPWLERNKPTNGIWCVDLCISEAPILTMADFHQLPKAALKICFPLQVFFSFEVKFRSCWSWYMDMNRAERRLKINRWPSRVWLSFDTKNRMCQDRRWKSRKIGRLKQRHQLQDTWWTRGERNDRLGGHLASSRLTEVYTSRKWVSSCFIHTLPCPFVTQPDLPRVYFQSKICFRNLWFNPQTFNITGPVMSSRRSMRSEWMQNFSDLRLQLPKSVMDTASASSSQEKWSWWGLDGPMVDFPDRQDRQCFPDLHWVIFKCVLDGYLPIEGLTVWCFLLTEMLAFPTLDGSMSKKERLQQQCKRIFCISWYMVFQDPILRVFMKALVDCLAQDGPILASRCPHGHGWRLGDSVVFPQGHGIWPWGYWLRKEPRFSIPPSPFYAYLILLSSIISWTKISSWDYHRNHKRPVKHHRPAEGTPGAWPYGPETWQTIANKYC